MTQRWKIVVTDYEYADLSIEERVFAELPNVELIRGQARTEEDVVRIAQYAHGILNQYAPISANVIQQLRSCKVISRFGVGVNTIDVPTATKHGICVANVTDYCVEEVSDHALTLLLSWARKIIPLHHSVMQGGWNYSIAKPIVRIQEQTVGVIGFGRIPQRLVQKLRAIHPRILVYDPFVEESFISSQGAEVASLETIFQEADYISVHTPLTEQTEGMIDQSLFELTTKAPVIINTARGPVINERDLIVALQNGQVKGAALDVTEQEPLPADHPFRKMDHVILTPHVAWYSEQSEQEMREKCARNVLQVLQGERPAYLVNTELAQNEK